MSSTISQIIDQIQSAIAQNGHYILSETAFDALPLQQLFSFLELHGVQIDHIVSESESRIDVAGTAELLGTDSVELEMSIEDKEGAIAASFSVKQVPAAHIPGVPGLALAQGQIALHLQGAAQELSGTVSGVVQANGVSIPAVFQVAKQEEGTLLNWIIAEIDLVTVAKLFLGGAELPEEMPAFGFKDIEVKVVPQTGKVEFEADAAVAIAFPANGEELASCGAHLSVKRESKDSATQCVVEVSSRISRDIVEGLRIQQVDLGFEYLGGDWKLHGNVNAVVLDAEVDLSASYEKTADAKTLTLGAELQMQAVNLADVGSINLSKIDLEMVRPAASEPGQTAPMEWSFSATGDLDIPGAIRSQGTLTIFKRQEEAGLEFKPEQATAIIPLPPEKSSKLALTFHDISLVRKGEAPAQSWNFEAAVDLMFKDFPAYLQPHLPQTPIAMSFIANSQGVALTVVGDIASIEYAIPDIVLSGSDRIHLGTAAIAITELAVTLGKTTALKASLGIGLPSELNTLFGYKKSANGQIERDASGRPEAAMDFFRVFDPQNPQDSLVKVALSISELGISLVPETSFIQAIELQEDANGNPFWHGDFGEFGAINVDVPTFSYTNTSFATSGGFEVVRPLALPLTPIKRLLEAAKLEGAADTLPDALPLDQEINTVNLVDKLIEKLEVLTGGLGDAADEVRAVLEVIDQSIDKLPTSFTDYLNFQMPQSLKFAVAASPDGSVRFDVSVKEGDPPIKLLFPGLMLGLPVLNGITLRSVSFGPTAGGSLFLLKIDADVDQFDLATMAIAVALPENLPNNPLPPTQNLHRRLRLDNLVMVLPTSFPVPIPLFYNNVGIQYLGLEGLLLQAHAQFPMPSPSFKTVGQVLTNIKGFFTDPDFLLPDTPPEGFSPNLFSLNQNFLQLPKYLGGSTLGTPGNGPSLTYAEVAHLLNGMKTLSLNELIQAVPVNYRVGNAGVTFGPVSGSLGWMVTTPDEFRSLSPQQKRLSDADANSMLALLQTAVPQPSQSQQGMVVFLRGSAAVNNLASFETTFGLAASTSGFTTAFQMKGSVPNVLTMDLGGVVKIDGKPTPAVKLAGSSRIMLANQSQPMFQGDVQLTDQRFDCSGSLNVYGVGGSVAMTIDRTRGAFMKGSINPIDIGVFKLNNATVDVVIQPNRMPTMTAQASVQLLGISNQTSIAISDAGFSFSTGGTLFNVFDATVQASGTRVNSTANFRVRAQMGSGGGRDFTRALKQEVTQQINGAIARSNADLSAAQQKVTTAQQEVNRWTNEVNRQRSIVNAERETANRKFRDAQNDVNAKQQEVNNLRNGIQSRRDRIRQLTPGPSCRTIFGRRICVPGIPSPSASAEITRLGIEIGGMETALATATGALKAAQEFLELTRRGLVSTPVDADPRVFGPLGFQKTAQEALVAANRFLDAMKTASSAILRAGDFVARNGLDALVLVRAASFEADINTAASGQVTMSIQLSYMNAPSTFSGGFNFNDATNSLRSLGGAITQSLVR
jgi:hypothetical protein